MHNLWRRITQKRRVYRMPGGRIPATKFAAYSETSKGRLSACAPGDAAIKLNNPDVLAYHAYVNCAAGVPCIGYLYDEPETIGSVVHEELHHIFCTLPGLSAAERHAADMFIDAHMSGDDIYKWHSFV